MKKIVTVAVIILATIFACFIALKNRDFSYGDKVDKYTNETYGYSLDYPEEYEVKEYTPQFISFGSSTESGFGSIVEVGVFITEDESVYTDFLEFMNNQAETICAEDGPNESVMCNKIDSDELFQTRSGIEGHRLLLDSTITYTSSEIPEGERIKNEKFGPVFAFDITEKVDGAKYAVLLIYPSPILDVSEETILKVAESLEIEDTNVTATTTHHEDEDDRVRAPEEVIMSIGEEKEVAGLSVKISRLIMDNRCPIDVICITAGTVEIEVILGSAGEEKIEKLSLNEKSIEALGYKITLKNVEPAPRSQRNIDTKDYRLDIFVEPVAKLELI